MVNRLRILLKLGQPHLIARRYFVTNGFDGALTMLGLIMGFYSAGDVALPVMISVCVGAAIALTVSGLSSAFISETAERQKELKDLEQALVHDLEDTAHAHAARLWPWLIAAVNGLSPLLIGLFIISPLWLSQSGLPLPLSPLECSIVLAFVCLFLLGVFLGRISGRSRFWSGVRTLLIALSTAVVIYWVSG